MTTTGSTKPPTSSDERSRAPDPFEARLAHAEALAALCVHLEATRAVFEQHDIVHGLELLRQAHELAAAVVLDNQHLPCRSCTDDEALQTQVHAPSHTYCTRHHHTPVELTVTGEHADPSPAAADLLANAAHQALLWLTGHAASSINISIDRRPDVVSLTVTGRSAPRDQPSTTQADQPNAQGAQDNRLSHLRARLAAIEGTLDRSADDRAWILTANAPTAGTR